MHEGLLRHGLKCCAIWQSHSVWEGVVCIGLDGHKKCIQTRPDMIDFLFLKGSWVVLCGPLHFCVFISRSSCSTVHNLERFIDLESNQKTFLSLYKQRTKSDLWKNIFVNTYMSGCHYHPLSCSYHPPLSVTSATSSVLSNIYSSAPLLKCLR